MKLVMLTDIGILHDAEGYDDIRKMLDVEVYHDTPDELVVERARGAEILLTNKVVLKKGHLEQLPDVKYIIMASTGTNAVDIDYCHERGIWCSNVPAYSTDSVAQLVFAHLLNIYTRADHYAVKNRDGAWTRSADFCYADTPLHELAGKTIGIVGLGAIGQKVAQIAQAFGMTAMAHSSKAELPQGITRAKDLDELYASSDIVTLHCPLAPNTKRMINSESLAKMKPGVVLVNTARGPLVDEQALSCALQSGRIAAYAADVVYYEPARQDNPLVGQPNVYLTPHNAWMTHEALLRLNSTIVRNIRNFLENGKPLDIV